MRTTKSLRKGPFICPNPNCPDHQQYLTENQTLDQDQDHLCIQQALTAYGKLLSITETEKFLEPFGSERPARILELISNLH